MARLPQYQRIILLQFSMIYFSSLISGQNVDSVTVVDDLLSLGIDADISSFINAGGNIQRSAVILVKPLTTDHVQHTVDVARSRGVKLRPVGAATSWSDLYPDEGQILLDMSAYQRSINESLEQLIELVCPTRAIQSWQVRAVSSLRLWELNELLLPHGLTFTSPSTFTNATIGGLVSTSSHGSQWLDDSLSDMVTAMTVVTGDGDVRDVTVTYDGDVLGALRACLGACGVILNVTLKVQPLGVMAAGRVIDLTLNDLVSDRLTIDWLMRSTFSWSVYWPVLVNVSQEDLDLIMVGGSRAGYDELVAWLPHHDMMRVRSFHLLQPQSGFTTKYVPDVTSINVSESVPVYEWESTGYLQDLIHTDSNIPHHSQVELFINDEDEMDYTGSRTAIQVLSGVLRAWVVQEVGLPVAGVELSWMRRGENTCYLCPSQVANVSSLVLGLNLLLHGPEGATEDFSRQLYTALRDSGLNVFPHLGKKHAFLTDFWSRDVNNDYSDTLQQLREVRHFRRLDTDDVFLNDALRNTVFSGELPTTAPIGGATRLHDYYMTTIVMVTMVTCMMTSST